MNKHTLYDQWAPPESPWSRWVKATPFAHLEGELPAPDLSILPTYDLEQLPAASAGFALVLDLPGPEAVAAAIGLAKRGYRPVSLFNACPPWPLREWPDGPSILSAVDVNGQLRALAASGETLASLSLPPDAPPAFMVEADRAAENKRLGPSWWDNRSLLFVSDFPSATFLRGREITRVLWLHQKERPMARDLLLALSSWQKEGIAIYQAAFPPTQTIEPVRLIPFSLFLMGLRLRLTAMFSLRRNPRGGFGAFWPKPSSG